MFHNISMKSIVIQPREQPAYELDCMIRTATTKLHWSNFIHCGLMI